MTDGHRPSCLMIVQKSQRGVCDSRLGVSVTLCTDFLIHDNSLQFFRFCELMSLGDVSVVALNALIDVDSGLEGT